MSQASDARIHNFLLGGSDHYEPDREAARELISLAPAARQVAQASRLFLLRAVRYLAGEHRIGQFLEHGAGLPLRESVHQVARRANRAARVVYIDNDPVVLAHARMMLDEGHTLIVDADMLDSQTILTCSERAGFLDRARPVAVLFTSALHCVSDERDPHKHISGLMDSLPSGSFLVLCHWASNNAAFREEASRRLQRLTAGQGVCVRSCSEVDRFFQGLEPVGDPIGDVAYWRTAAPLKLRSPDRTLIAYGGVARKR
ncbi:SAM-dependent methyltransferase [Streptomyces sp. NPDC058733]|uniref:SAM-dependent methyltransferase n=1 Tax=unclassified Streptomyces TaxID=2593676 RepID=UPI003451C047